MKYFYLLALLCFSLNSVAQIDVVSKDGKKYLLFDNGTWKEITESILDTAKMELTPCSEAITIENDKMTGISTVISKDVVVAEGKQGYLGLKWSKSIKAASELSLLLVTELSNHRVFCIERQAPIKILFRDGERLNLMHYGDFNCDGRAFILFSGWRMNKKDIQTLKEKDIESIRIQGKDIYFDVDFTLEASTLLRAQLSCISTK